MLLCHMIMAMILSVPRRLVQGAQVMATTEGWPAATDPDSVRHIKVQIQHAG